MISVIVPVYGVEKYLPKCIESLVKQTFKDIEIVLIDDGSPDSCGKICDEYAENYEQLVVIHQVNQGVSVARNAGLKIAKGEYIGFVDPDDWIAPEMYESMHSAMKETNADLCICGYDYYDEHGKVDENRRYNTKENETITQKDVMYRFFDIPPTIRHVVANKLFKKELLQDNKFKEGLHSSEDVLFLDEYVLKIKNAVVVHQPYYKSLVRQGSATHGGLSINSLADSFEAHERMYLDSIRRYPELKNHAAAFLLDVCTLKYNEAKEKWVKMEENEKKSAKEKLKIMLKFIKKYALYSILDKEIYWKTRVAYLIMK